MSFSRAINVRDAKHSTTVPVPGDVEFWKECGCAPRQTAGAKTRGEQNKMAAVLTNFLLQKLTPLSTSTPTFFNFGPRLDWHLSPIPLDIVPQFGTSRFRRLFSFVRTEVFFYHDHLCLSFVFCLPYTTASWIGLAPVHPAERSALPASDVDLCRAPLGQVDGIESASVGGRGNRRRLSKWLETRRRRRLLLKGDVLWVRDINRVEGRGTFGNNHDARTRARTCTLDITYTVHWAKCPLSGRRMINFSSR